MPDNRLLAALFAVTVCGVPLAAQEGVSCSGPGAVFGVTSYQCASCSFTKGDRTTKIYTSFQTEPVVLTTAKESALQPGDVVEAVNGEPITTAAGAEQFTSPRGGKANVTVRRGGSRVQLSAVPLKCDGAPGGLPPSAPLNSPLVVVDGVVVSDLNQVPSGSIESVDVLKGPAATLLYGSRATNGVIVISTKRSPGTTTLRTPPSAAATNEPLIIVDGVVVPNASEADASASAGGRRFGFAIGCVPSCTRARAADGADYYKFDGYPPVVALTPGGAAERAGIQVGDLISQVDGKSILSEEGATRFFRGNKTETMNVTVVRNRQSIGYVLKAR